jgi:hypothetical protein
MTSFAIAALAVLVGLHLLLTFALIARVRALQDQLTGTGARLPEPGTEIGKFAVVTPAGETLSEQSLGEQPTLVGFFIPGCSPCERSRGELLDTPPALPMLAFVAGTEVDPGARALVSSLEPIARVAYTIDGDAVNQAFRPNGFPSFFRIEQGKVAAAGHRLADVVP